MSHNAAPSAVPPPAASQPNAANAITAGAAVSSNANSSQLNMSDTVSNMDELRKKAPKVYNAMMQGLAMNICNEWQHQQERLKEMEHEARRNG